MRFSAKLILLLIVTSWLTLHIQGSTLAVPSVAVSLTGAGDHFIGQNPIALTVTFDNTAPPSPANVGYGPFLDMYFPVNGADGGAQQDGLDYVAGSATYLGEAVTETILVFPAGPLGAPCSAVQSSVNHPYAVSIANSPIPVCGTPGDKLVVFQLPLGSFTPDQPAVPIQFSASLSNFADLNVPLTIAARGGFQYGTDPLNNPGSDPSFFTDGTPLTITDNPVGAVNPILLELEKTQSAPEAEVATGPNFPQSYTVTITAAPGQTITNLDVFDYVDDTIVITGISAPGASSLTLGGSPVVFPVGPVVANGTANRLVVTYASFSSSVTLTINYFVPLRDAGGANVIPANTGATTTTTNRANTIGDWDPLDPRDAAGTNNAVAGDTACPACAPLTTHDNQPLPVQKTVTNTTDSQNSPGDVLQYTLNFQISDFFALDNVDIFDVIKDGQRLTGNPTFSYTQHGVVASGAVTNFQVREYFTGGTPGSGALPDADVSAAAGDTVLAVDLAAELALNGFNEMLGGCVPAGGTGAGDPNCTVFNGGPTTLTLTYQTTIQDSFSDAFPSGDASVDNGDALTNTAAVEVDTMLNTTNLAPTGAASAAQDGSNAGLSIAEGASTKTIYAITNPQTGVTTLNPAGVPLVSPGDIVTFRLRYAVPSTDFEDLAFNDYLPLPILDANEVVIFNDLIANGSNTIGTGIPAAGQAMWGPTGVTDGNLNFRSRMTTLGVTLQSGSNVPILTSPGGLIPALCGGSSINTAENTLNFCLGDFDDPGNANSVIDILFSVTVNNDPFADGLFLANLLQGGTGSTNASDSISEDIVRFELGQPVVALRKGISDTNNPNESFSEVPNAALVSVGSTVTPPFSGTIESALGGGNGQVNNGMNADVSGVDAGDTVRFVITLQNTGGSSAFDITLVDTLPTGLVCNPATLNLNVTSGNGTAVTYTNLGTADPCDFFSSFDGNAIDGIELDDPVDGLLQSPGSSPARAVIVITYDLTISGSFAGATLTNTTSLSSFAGNEGGQTHLSDPGQIPTDSANIGITGLNLEKAIIASSEAHTSDASLPNTGVSAVPVVVGEVVTFRLTVDVPEGAQDDVVVSDLLPAGLSYVDGSTRIYTNSAAAVSFTNLGAVPNSAPGSVIPTDGDSALPAAAGTVVFATGTGELEINLGDVVNADNDADTEQIILTFQTIILNNSSNALGGTWTNTAEVSVAGNTPVTSNAVSGSVEEPGLSVDKSINTTLSDPSGVTSFDAGDTVVYDVVVTASAVSGRTTAFDVVIADAIDANLDLIDVNFLGTPGYATTSDNSDYAAPGQAVNVTISELRIGDSITIRVTTTVRATVALGQVVPNTGGATWTSLPGAQGTGNATPGTSGASNGERNGSGTGENDYTLTDTVNFTASGSVNTIKTIDGSSEAHTSDGTADTSADPRPMVVGEVLTYRLVVEVPEGTSPDLQMTDTLPPNVEFIAGSARISFSANNSMGVASVPGILNEINPTTTVPAGLISFGVTGPRELRFDIGPVVNNDADNAATAELLIIEFQAVVVNSSANSLNAVWSNDFEVDLNNDGTDEDVSNEVFSILQEPVVTATKAIVGTAPSGALEGVTYDVVITAGSATNQTTAYNLNVVDVLHPDLRLDSVVIQTNPGYVSIDNDASTYGVGGPVNLSLNRLEAGDSVTLRIVATVQVSVSPGETVDNDAVVTWTSLPGTQGTGNTTPGASGASNGERNGSGTGENDHTTTTNVVNFTTLSAEPVKSIDGTSDAGTSEAGDGSTGNERAVAVGEEVTYRLVMTLPAATTISLRMDDILATGVEFVAGSARVSYLADTAPSFNGDFVGILNESEPSLPFPASNISFDFGTRTLSFDFGSVINNDGDSNFEYLIVEFTVVVTDIPANANGQILANEFAVVLDEGLPTEVIIVSNAVGIIVVAPAVNITKTFSPDAQVRAASTTLTLVVSNNASDGATGPAYDLQVTDVLDDWLNVESVSNIAVSFNAAATSFGSTSTTSNSVITAGFASGVSDTVDVRISGLPINGQATITITLQIDPNADPLLLSRTITNTANVIFDSLASDVTPDDEDRQGTDDANDDLNVVKPTLLVTKTDSVDPVAAGALMSYTVTVQNTGTPNFAATNVQFNDQLPAGFIVTLVQPSQGTCSPIVGGVLTCAMGTIASGASANVVITGRYPATTASGTITNNISYVSSTQGNNGNDGNDTPTDNDDERAEEPTTILRQTNVRIIKTVNDPTPSETDLIAFTLNVDNIGSSAATNVVVTDSLPTGLTFVQFVPSTLPCFYTAPTLTCTLPTLNTGQTRTIGIEATVDAGTPGGTVLTNTATVTVSEPETDLSNNQSSTTVTINSTDLRVEKVVNNPAPNTGDSLIYTVTVTNLGPGIASGIQITDNLNAISGITYVSDNSAASATSYDSATGIWTLTGITLNAGQSRSLNITATVNAGAGSLPQPIVNTASLTDVDQTDSNSSNNSDTASFAVGGVDVSLVKGVNNAAPNEGATVIYSLIVENRGPITATNMVVTDQLDIIPVTYISHAANPVGTTYNPTTGVWTIPSLPPGQSRRLDITVTVDAGTAGSSITNTATISSLDQTDADASNNTDDAVITVGRVDLAISKSVDNPTPAEGATLVYSVTITNNGPGNASGVVVADALPAGVTYVSDTSATVLNSSGIATSYSGGNWTIGTLNTGVSLTLQITTTVDVGTSGTTITNTASLGSVTQPDSNSANNSDTAVIAVSGLDVAVSKTVNSAAASEGDTLVYSITVTNNGPVNATNLVITDNLNALPLNYVSDTSATVLDSLGAATAYSTASGAWTIGQLNSGASLTLQITVTVNTGASGTTITNSAALTSLDQADSNASNNTDDAVVTVGGVDIAVAKVVNNPTPAQGSTVTYTITVENEGTGIATAVNISEDLPLDGVSLTYISHSASQGTFTPGTPGTWAIGTLTAGQIVTLQLTVRVEISSGQILNTASLSSLDQPDSDPTNNSDTATITLNGIDLAVTKTVDNPTPPSGATVTYSIVASNNGPAVATGVTVQDILPAGITYGADNAAALQDDTGATTTFNPATGDWIIGQLNAGSSRTLTIQVTVNVSSGQVLNTADITGNEPDSNSANNTDDALLAVNGADLSLTKTINNNAPQVGDSVTYTLTVSNAGPNTAFGVAVTDTLPTTVTYSGIFTASQGSFDGTLWSVGTLPANSAATLQITVQVTFTTGTFVNVAEVTASDQADPDSTPNNGDPSEDDYAQSSFLFDPPFGRKVFNENGLPQLEWNVVWVNPNSSPLTVTVSDPVPAGTTFVTGSLTCSSPGTVVVSNCSYDPVANQVTFSGSIFPNAGATPATLDQASNRLIITYRTTVAASVNQVLNQAILRSVNGDNVAVESTWQRTIANPTAEPGGGGTGGSGGDSAAVTISKGVDPALVFPGENLTWTIEVRNTSAVTATGVVVRDTLPPAVSIQSTSADSGSVSVNGQDVVWNIGTLAPGQSMRLRIITQVNAAVDSDVTNTAFVSGDNFPGQQASATARRVSTLPNTGETPWWAAVLWGITALVLGGFLSGWFLRRNQYRFFPRNERG
jgi:large repetitive protein